MQKLPPTSYQMIKDKQFSSHSHTSPHKILPWNQEDIIILTTEREQCLEINRFCPCSALLVPICRPTKRNPLILLFLPFSFSPLFIRPAETFSLNLVVVTLSDERSHANLSPLLRASFSQPAFLPSLSLLIVHNSSQEQSTLVHKRCLFVEPITANCQYFQPTHPSSSPSKELVPVFSLANDDVSPTFLCQNIQFLRQICMVWK